MFNELPDLRKANDHAARRRQRSAHIQRKRNRRRQLDLLLLLTVKGTLS